jgi:hypothetical protein
MEPGRCERVLTVVLAAAMLHKHVEIFPHYALYPVYIVGDPCEHHGLLGLAPEVPRVRHHSVDPPGTERGFPLDLEWSAVVVLEHGVLLWDGVRMNLPNKKLRNDMGNSEFSLILNPPHRKCMV